MIDDMETSDMHDFDASEGQRTVFAENTTMTNIPLPTITAKSENTTFILDENRSPISSTVDQDGFAVPRATTKIGSLASAKKSNIYTSASINMSKSSLPRKNSTSIATARTASVRATAVSRPSSGGNSSSSSSSSYAKVKSNSFSQPASTRSNSAQAMRAPIGTVRAAPRSKSVQGLAQSANTSIYRKSNITGQSSLDISMRLDGMEKAYEKITSELQSVRSQQKDSQEENNLQLMKLQEMVNFERERCSQLEESKSEILNRKAEADANLIFAKQKVEDQEKRIEEMKANHEKELAQLKEKFEESRQVLRNTLDVEIRQKFETQIQEKEREIFNTRSVLEREIINLESEKQRIQSEAKEKSEQLEANLKKQYNDSVDELKRNLERQLNEQIQDLEEGKKQIDKFRSDHLEKQKEYEKEIKTCKTKIEELERQLAMERKLTENLKATVSEMGASQIQMESLSQAKKSQIETLAYQLEQKCKEMDQMKAQLEDALEERKKIKGKLLEEETVRRKLHNTIQELKGNIRVFCRLRPALPHENSQLAEILIPKNGIESKELCLQTEGQEMSLGSQGMQRYPFSFDRVFDASARNEEIYDEISQLVQSALDGYNVCIFAYGQTGSGKTYTMSSKDGMIPRAVTQIYDVAQQLQEKGWRYAMSGEFLEIYNETINDLLLSGSPDEKKKYEIHHDSKTGTTVSNLISIKLDSREKVEGIINRASKNRSVAATQANDRSSRSHAVFTLRLHGENSVTGERSRGLLNLIDLAGSERLTHSQSTGERLKETQSINKSLASLGDVIAALGSAKEGGYIPYRNSKVKSSLQVETWLMSSNCIPLTILYLFMLLTQRAVDVSVAAISGWELQSIDVREYISAERAFERDDMQFKICDKGICSNLELSCKELLTV